MLIENGLEGMADAMATMLNEAMKIERSSALRAEPGERSPERLGYTNGFKPKRLILLLILCSTCPAMATFTNVSASRGTFASADLSLFGFPPLTDSYDSGEILGFGPTTLADGASVFLSTINKAEGSVGMLSGFLIDPQVTVAFADGYAGSNSSVADPGFSSTADAFSISSFVWDFTIDVDTLLIIDGWVEAEFFGGIAFGVGSFYDVLLTSSITLTNTSTGNDVFDYTVTDNVDDGIPVTSAFYQYELLLPGSYQLSAGSVSQSFGFQDAATANGADYSFAIEVPEPSFGLMLIFGAAGLIGLAAMKRNG